MRLVLSIVFVLSSLSLVSQSIFDKPDSLNKKRLTTVIVTESVGSIGSIIALNEIWYKQYPRSSFHAFNDNQEWLQMDKFGHAMTAYYVGFAGIRALQWTGLEEKKSVWWGGALGLMYLTKLEILDGFSTQWGFSFGDMIANSAGAGLVIGQEFAWQEQRIKLKVSAHHTHYANFRPGLMGSGNAERLLKDYNGQTYWLSCNISSFLRDDTKFPKWLNVAFGYGAEEMISGNDLPGQYCNGDPWCESLNRYRQFYLSLDADLTRIKTKKKWLKTLFGTIGWVKIPAPTLSFTKKGFSARASYY